MLENKLIPVIKKSLLSTLLLLFCIFTTLEMVQTLTYRRDIKMFLRQKFCKTDAMKRRFHAKNSDTLLWHVRDRLQLFIITFYELEPFLTSYYKVAMPQFCVQSLFIVLFCHFGSVLTKDNSFLPTRSAVLMQQDNLVERQGIFAVLQTKNDKISFQETRQEFFQRCHTKNDCVWEKMSQRVNLAPGSRA